MYVDASFGNIEDQYSQIGYLISIRDNKNISPIHWKSRRARRVAKSTIEAEALGLGEAAEGAIFLGEIWREIMGEGIPIEIKTDSRTLEKALKTTSGVFSRRLRIDIAAIKEMMEKGEIRTVVWISSGDQVADIFTKKGVCDKNLREYIKEKVGGEEKSD